MGCTLVYAFNTHCHADHVTGTGRLKEHAPHVRSCIARAAGAKADILLEDRQTVHWANGTRSLTVLATPGHTKGCISYHDADMNLVCTGDALLIDGCGRYVSAILVVGAPWLAVLVMLAALDAHSSTERCVALLTWCLSCTQHRLSRGGRCDAVRVRAWPSLHTSGRDHCPSCTRLQGALFLDDRRTAREQPAPDEDQGRVRRADDKSQVSISQKA